MAAAAAPDQTDGTAPTLRAGWSGGTLTRVTKKSNAAVGKVTQEAFPSLGGGSQSTNASNKLKRSGVRPGGSSTFAAIQQAANPPPSSWSGPPPTRASAPLSYATTGPSQSQRLVPNAARAAAPNMTSADQFPTLGGGGGGRSTGPSSQPYAAAQALARQQKAGGTTPTYAAAAPRNTAAGRAHVAAPPPQLSSASHFPPPPQANNNAASVRNRVLGNNTPTLAASSNVLQVPSSSYTSSTNAKSTVEDLKVTLGKQKYKELKRLTADFANDGLSGEAYIDRVAALFEGGYGDADFWGAVPSLVESCPASALERSKALTYMDHLHRMKNGAMNAESAASSKAKKPPPPAGNNWSSQPSIPAAPPPSSGSWSAPSRTKPATQTSVSRTNFVVPNGPKKKGAWGGGGSSTTMRAKAAPGSVALAAANAEQPQNKTATKFMAQEQKKAAAAKSNGGGDNNNGKKKKSKQKNELKQLAFGS
uniref:Uncharacterized protein n=1 Tax=Entomoneis paludosa TaxID=265537 RepID=A0A7S3DSG6_9STRA